MLDISWWHIFLFGLTAIILIPSKDLPGVLRQLGRYAGDARRMASDFRRQVDDALRETELADIKDSLTKDMADIEKTASLSEESRALNSAFTAAAATAGTQPETRLGVAAAASASGLIIPQAGPSLAVSEADAAAFGSGATVPMQPLKVPQTAAVQPANGKAAEARSNDGIEIVRAGRGSVAQRAAAAWKKSAGASNAEGESGD